LAISDRSVAEPERTGGEQVLDKRAAIHRRDDIGGRGIVYIPFVIS
jgi:hypothetical protein